MNGFIAVLLKEFAHIRRQPSTLFFAFVIPVFQLTVFGYAIQLEIEHLRTVVLNLDGRDESRHLIESFRNTNTFDIVEHVGTNDAFEHALISGRVNVGIRIPPDYTDRLLRREQADVQVWIDGSDAQRATTALNAANLLGTRLSLRMARDWAESAHLTVSRDPAGRLAPPVDIRPRLLFNASLRSEHFFVPALVGIIMQIVTLFLTSFAIVRERELGTLEQLFVTPVGRGGLVLGKLAPYAVLGFIESLIVLLVMVFVFRVPIQGDILLLLPLSLLFIVTALGLGLLVSTVTRTQLGAVQVAFLVMLPSVLLSGFMFPREAMPLPIYLLSAFIPVTYFLEILRGVILRGAEFADLIPHVIGLCVCCAAVLGIAVLRFRKNLD